MKITSDEVIEQATDIIESAVSDFTGKKADSRWTAKKLINPDDKLCSSICDFIGHDISKDEKIQVKILEAVMLLDKNGITPEDAEGRIVSSIIRKGEEAAKECVSFDNESYLERDKKVDRILTNRVFGIPIMVLALGVILWITITGANIPSGLLSTGLFWIGDKMTGGLNALGAPEWVNGVLVLGIYRVLAWVVSVMLPPMAIFFPLFTLLEDLGYLPRIAFNLDRHFKRACACGKQSLTMCMGIISL